MSKHPDTTACRSSWINPIFTGTKDESWYCQEHKESVWPNKDLDPSSSLHTKLQTILTEAFYAGTADPEIEGSWDAETSVAQILQAFEEANYVHVPDVELVTRWERGSKPEVFMVNGSEVMTGPEWFSRFKAELLVYFNNVQGGEHELWQVEQNPLPALRALEAARRAAGVSDE